MPDVVPITFTAKMHEAPAASVVPETATLFDPPAAVMIPLPQLPVRPLGVATDCPGGKLSLKPTPLRERLVFGFTRLKVRVVVPFNATLADPNALAIVGGRAAGEGGLLDELPPHATFPTTLMPMRKNDAKRDVNRGLRLIGFRGLAMTYS